MSWHLNADYQAILNSIRSSYEDDLPRSVAADMLDDMGQPERAEFIRVQCELAANPDVPADRKREMQIRCNWLMSTNYDRWLPPMGRGGENRLHGEFRRGFVAEVRGTLELLGEHLPAILQREPLASPRVEGGTVCLACSGTGTLARASRAICNTCGGTGSAGGRVVGVEVTDESPHRVLDAGGNPAWYWPPDLYGGVGSGHPTELAARHALAAAIWAEAMRAAGLPIPGEQHG